MEESAKRLLNISDVESVVSGLSNRSEVPYVLQIPAPRLPELHENEITVSVCHVEEPNHFWCHRLEDRSKRDYGHINKLIGPQGSFLERWDIKVPVVKGNLVMGPFKVDNAVEYYRAKVLSTQQDVPIHEQRVRLYFIDFGNAGEAHVKDLRVVPDGLLKFPPLAIECYLTGVGPSLINDPKGKWTKSGKEWFEEQTVDQQLTARVSTVPIIIFKNRIHLTAKFVYAPIFLTEIASFYAGVFGRQWNHIYGSDWRRWQLGEFNLCSDVGTQLRRQSGRIFHEQTR